MKSSKELRTVEFRRIGTMTHGKEPWPTVFLVSRYLLEDPDVCVVRRLTFASALFLAMRNKLTWLAWQWSRIVWVLRGRASLESEEGAERDIECDIMRDDGPPVREVIPGFIWMGRGMVLCPPEPLRRCGAASGRACRAGR